uniref:Vesicle transport protein n=1 Tax=Romanomermis culicivorax TaxID=13658 RepID=A0A915KVM4_ROMCU
FCNLAHNYQYPYIYCIYYKKTRVHSAALCVLTRWTRVHLATLSALARWTRVHLAILRVLSRLTRIHLATLRHVIAQVFLQKNVGFLAEYDANSHYFNSVTSGSYRDDMVTCCTNAGSVQHVKSSVMSQSPPKFSLKSYVDYNKSKSNSHLPTFLASKFQTSTPVSFLNTAVNRVLPAVNFASSSNFVNGSSRRIGQNDDQVNLLSDTDDIEYDSKGLKIQISSVKSTNCTAESSVFDKWLPDSFKTKEKSMFSMTRTQRLAGFALCIIAGTLCFGLASMYIPVLVFKARKFGALYSLGSCFMLASFALLRGPAEYLKQSFSLPRLPVTLSYFGSLMATLYCSLWIVIYKLMRINTKTSVIDGTYYCIIAIMNTLLTILCVVVQVLTLLWLVFTCILLIAVLSQRKRLTINKGSLLATCPAEKQD